MSAHRWYLPHDPDGGIPGTFPPEDAPTRVYGGPLDGDALVAPRRAGELVHGSIGAEAMIQTSYGLYQRVHAPELGAEGPIGIEWVWMTAHAYRNATEARSHPC